MLTPSPWGGVADIGRLSVRMSSAVSSELVSSAESVAGVLWLAERGAMRCRSARTLRVLPPTLALWMPRREVHAVEALGSARLRRIDLALPRQPGDAGPLPGRVVVLRPLLAALAASFDGAGDAPGGHDVRPRDGAGPGSPEVSRLDLARALIRDEFEAVASLPIGVALPQSGWLRRAAGLAVDGEAGAGGLEALAESVGAHPRSLARALRREVGVSYGDWRAQVRLARMVQLWSEGRSLGECASVLGYAGPSALSFMVRQVVGMTPSQLLGIGGRAVPAEPRRALPAQAAGAAPREAAEPLTGSAR